MRQKTALIYGFLLLFVIIIVHSVEENLKLLSEPFFVFGRELRLSTALSIAIFSGFFVFFVIALALGIDRILFYFFEKLKERSKRESEQRYFKGIDAMMQARPLEAIKHFRESILLNSHSVPAMIKLGDALRESGEIDEAIDWHKKALLEENKNITALYALATDYLKKENSEEAKKFLNEIISIQPKRALYALRLLRNIYIKERNFFKAKEFQKKILKASVLKEEIKEDEIFTVSIDYEIYSLLLEQKRIDEAILGFESLKRNFPNFYPTYIKIAEALLLSDDEESAFSNLKEGFLNSGSIMPLLTMEKIFLEKGEPEKAIKEYENIISNNKINYIPRFLLARLLFKLGFFDESESILKDLEYELSHFYLLEYLLAKIYERRQEYAKACSHYSEMFRIFKPQEFVFVCECGEKSEHYKDFCEKCLKCGTYHSDLEEELNKAVILKEPAYYNYSKSTL